MLCVLACLFRVGPGLKISRVIAAQAKSVLRLDDVLQYQLCPLVVEKYELPLFTIFGMLCPAFSFADVDTYVACTHSVDNSFHTLMFLC